MGEEGSGRYLVFELDGELYAIEVEKVEVVLETARVTRVPNAAAHLRGVINYRGAVIPVADLRVRFGAEPTDLSGGSSIVVLQIRYEEGELTIGIPADTVREVMDLDPGKIEKAPTIGSKAEDGLIRGVCEKDGRFIVILDIDKAFSLEALGQGREAGPAR